MPRGFLVKRTKHSVAFSHRARHFSDDERSESGSSDQDQETYIHTNFGSPDSGYSASPTAVSFRERSGSQTSDHLAGAYSPVSSPITVSASFYPSPLYYTAFDRLRVCSGSPLDLKTPEKHRETVTSPEPHVVQPQTTQHVSEHDKVKVNLADSLSLSHPKSPRPRVPTPISPNKRRGQTENSENKVKSTKKPKAARKINFDEDNSSPVSGTIIRNLSEVAADGARIVCGDIDSKFNCVEVTPEAKAEIARIDNKIGEYVCQLCKDLFDDAFQLAQHRCSMIINIEYRCPDCDKVFNCPANLASHRRWHKPRTTNANNANANKMTSPANILPAAVTSPSQQQNGNVSSTCSSESNSDSTNNNLLINANTNINTNFPNTNKNVNSSTSTTTTTTNANLNEALFPCDKCNKKFRRQAYLRKHQLSHASESIFVCQYCSKIFQNDNGRARHEATHTSGKELTCTLCNTAFPNKIVLEKHVRQHGNETFTCKHCDSTFCSSPGLTRHVNKCHPSENRQVILLQLPVQRTC